MQTLAIDGFTIEYNFSLTVFTYEPKRDTQIEISRYTRSKDQEIQIGLRAPDEEEEEEENEEGEKEEKFSGKDEVRIVLCYFLSRF